MLTACSGPAPARPTPPSSTPVAHKNHTCSDAAHGLEGATRGVREPDRALYDGVVSLCGEDTWGENALTCFAEMAEGDLVRCAKLLEAPKRTRLFDLITSGESVTALAVLRYQLDELSPELPACHDFRGAVIAALGCGGMSLALRVRLGSDTADYLRLPTARLDEAGKQSIADTCTRSLAQLREQTATIGCTL